MAERSDRFTEHARRTLTHAQAEALRLNHAYIGPEHLLLGLIQEDDAIACRVLANLDVKRSEVRSGVESTITHAGRSIAGEIGLTVATKRVIELAVDEARLLSHHYIGTEHILLGLLREEEGIAARTLAGLGVSLDRARAETARVVMQR